MYNNCVNNSTLLIPKLCSRNPDASVSHLALCLVLKSRTLWDEKPFGPKTRAENYSIRTKKHNRNIVSTRYRLCATGIISN